MRTGSDVNQMKQVKKRIALYWISLFLMFLYIFVVGEMGLGDSRKMSELADVVSKVIIFGGIIFIIAQIVHNKKLLKDAGRMQMEFQMRQSEREKLLYEKTGGIVFEILFYLLLFVTCTAALANEAAFRVSFLILAISIVLKVAVYAAYSRKY